MRRVLAAVAAVALFAAGCTGSSAGEDSFPAASFPEPEWAVACESGFVPVDGLGELSLPCLGDQEPVNVGTRDGRPLVIVLWASWCPPCIEEAPEVEAFYQQYGDQIDVLGVDTADTRDKGRWFAEDFELTYPSVFDADEVVQSGLGVAALPGIAFVAPDGAVVELITDPDVDAERLALTAEAAFGLELT